jgi:glucose-1-phosphatase
MIKAIIFDMGGVLILNEIKKVYIALGELLGVDGVELAALQFSHRQEFMDGTCSTEDFCLVIKNHFHLELSKEEIATKWKTAFLGQLRINEKLYDIIDFLKIKYALAVITDAPHLHAEINKEKGLYKPFKEVIISSEVGFVKPQKEIFELALRKLNVEPQNCIFVDDDERNIAIARNLGFKALQFVGNDSLLNELNRLGVKVPINSLKKS